MNKEVRRGPPRSASIESHSAHIILGRDVGSVSDPGIVTT